MIFFVRFERVKEKLIRHAFYKNFFVIFLRFLTMAIRGFVHRAKAISLPRKDYEFAGGPAH